MLLMAGSHFGLDDRMPCSDVRARARALSLFSSRAMTDPGIPGSLRCSLLSTVSELLTVCLSVCRCCRLSED